MDISSPKCHSELQEIAATFQKISNLRMHRDRIQSRQLNKCDDISRSAGILFLVERPAPLLSSRKNIVIPSGQSKRARRRISQFDGIRDYHRQMAAMNQRISVMREGLEKQTQMDLINDWRRKNTGSGFSEQVEGVRLDFSNGNFRVVVVRGNIENRCAALFCRMIVGGTISGSLAAILASCFFNPICALIAALFFAAIGAFVASRL